MGKDIKMNKKIIPVSEVANLTRSKYFPLKKGKIEIVPVQYDLTAHHAIAHLNTWDL
jgi:hypothetical protein